MTVLGPLAQLVEQGTLNPKVVGSIPTRPISEIAVVIVDVVSVPYVAAGRRGLGGNKVGTAEPTAPFASLGPLSGPLAP